MGVRTYSQPVVEFHGEALTTGTAVLAVGIPPGCNEVMFNGAAAHRVQFGPRLVFMGKTTDNAATFTNYTAEVTDRDTATVAVLSGLDIAANGDYWYLVSDRKFAGATITMGSAVNGTASVMTGYYWNGAWTNATITDGTANGGATLAQTGNITFTPAADWVKTDLGPYKNVYVIRFQVSVALDASTEIAEVALHCYITNAAYGYFALTTDYVMGIDVSETGSLCASAAAPSTLNVTWMRHVRRGNS